MARGDQAKQNLIKLIIEALPKEMYLGVYNKRHYFWSEENGNKIQIAIAMTCSNMPEEQMIENKSEGINFSKPKNIEIPQEELDNVQAIMKELNLI